MNKIKITFFSLLTVAFVASTVFWIESDSDSFRFYSNERYAQKEESSARNIKFLKKERENLTKQLQEKDLQIQDMQESIDVLTFQIHDLVEKHKISIERKGRMLIEGKRSFAF